MSIYVLGGAAWDNRRRERKRREDGYGERDDALRELGYQSYSAYLKSEEWKLLRAEVMPPGCKCIVCSREATDLHHFSYSVSVLLGVHKELLLPLCRKCHEDVELDEKRKKRPLWESQAILIKNLKVRGKEDLAKRIRNKQSVAARQSAEADKRGRAKEPRQAEKFDLAALRRQSRREQREKERKAAEQQRQIAEETRRKMFDVRLSSD